MVCSAVVMFTCITSWFVPVRSSADVDWGYYGINEGMPYNWSTEFNGYSGYNSMGVEDKLRKTPTKLDTDFFILTFVYAPNGIVQSVNIYTLEYAESDIDYYINGKYLVVYSKKGNTSSASFNVTSHKVGSCGNSSDTFSNVSINIPLYYDGYTIYVSDHFVKHEDAPDKPNIFELTKDLLSNLWDDGTIFGNNYDLTGLLPYDLWSGKWTDTIDNVGSDFIDYFKGVLEIDDKVSSSDVEQILYDIDTNNYDTNNYLVNVDSSKRTQLTNTWNNYKRFINNSTTYDTINNVYKPNTSYLNTVYNNSNYFQTYIQSGGSFDTSDIVAILNVISTQLDTTIFNALADIKGGITALGGVFATAINTAFADLHLDSLIDSINANLDKIDNSLTTINNNVTIGNSINNSIKNNIDTDNSSDDDTTLIGKLNLSLKKLGDDITTKLGDINLNIKNITNNNPTIGDCNHDTEDDDFWKEVQSRLSTKIPLYKQCVDLISPITSVKYDDALGSHDDYLLENNTIDTPGTELTASVQSIDNDGQLDIYTRYYLGDLVVVSYDDKGEPTGLKIPFNNPDWNVEEYVLDTTSYTSSKHKGIFSDIFLTVCYIAFAWSIVHRLSVWFGRSRSDNANNDTVER